MVVSSRNLPLSGMSTPRSKSPARRSTSRSRLDEGQKIPTFELQGSAEGANDLVDVRSPIGVDNSLLTTGSGFTPSAESDPSTISV